MNNNYYNKKLKKYARELRTESISIGEKYLWKALLKSNQMGVKFKRQRPIDWFIVDFVALDIKLIVEVDWSSHLNKAEHDRNRQNKLEQLGFHLLRFSESEVLHQLNDVYEKIEHAIHVLKTEHPPPNYSFSDDSSPTKDADLNEPQPTYRRGSGLITA